VNIPHSREAEWSVLAQMLSRPDAIPQVIGMQVAVEDFFDPGARLVFETAVEAYYSDERVDAVTIGDKLRVPLSHTWSVDEGQVVSVLHQQASARGSDDSLLDHSQLVRRHSDNRKILALCEQAKRAIAENSMSPEEISDMIGSESVKIATGTEKRGQIIPFIDVGREYVKYLQRLQLARDQGIELAAYFGLKFIDQWTKGVAPTELMLVAGEPGVGKSALVWEMALGFGRRQMLKGDDKRVGTLVLSLEMALVGSSARIATALSGVDSDLLREGTFSKDDLSTIIKAWKGNKDLPLFWNFASNFKMSQMRALIVEAIRRHNIGLVIVDHFRMFDPDRRINNPNQEDEAKARFLKEDIAKDLNLAVVCLAHTTKPPRDSDARPRLADLRGSGMVSAHADIAAFMYRPWMYATENEKLEGVYRPTDAELIFRKNRNGALGTTEFHFDPATMTIKD
jgi:replicative DNA helicase